MKKSNDCNNLLNKESYLDYKCTYTWYAAWAKQYS